MRVRTLGGLALEGSELTRPQPLLLLTYVALEGPKGRRELADLFFMHTADPRDSLSTALRHLRVEAEGCVDLSGGKVACAVPCDATELMEAISAERFQAGISLYQGSFAAGLDLSLEHEVEEWVFETRERLGRMVRTSHLALATLALENDDPDEARRLAEQSLDIDGAPEPGLEELARMLAILERVGSTELSALRTMAAEYDLDTTFFPSAVPRSHTSSLPAPRTSFVGREAEIARLSRSMLADRAHLTTIIGLGGLGKTRLAIELARRLEEDRNSMLRDGIHFIGLEHAETARDARGRIGISVGVPPPTAYDVSMLASSIGEAHLLLVLDNFEHLDAAEVGLPHILASCANVRILATSRKRLGIAGEHLFHLEGLDAKRGEDPGRTIVEAPALFLERAHQARPGRSYSRVEMRAVESICVALGGHPLGIELAASLTRYLTPDAIEKELRKSTGLLHDERVDGPERHRDLNAAIEPSWKRLSRADRLALLNLSVLPGPFDHHVAIAVADAPIAALVRLSDRSMLGSDGARFHFHPVVSAFLRQTARAAPQDVSAAEARLVRWAHSLLEDAAEHVRQDPHAVLERLEDNIPNLQRAIGVALGHEAGQPGIRMVVRLVSDCNFLAARGGNDTLLGLLERAIDLADKLGEASSALSIAIKLGNARRELHGDLLAASNAYEQALRFARRTDSRGREAILLSLLGTIACDREEGDPLALLEEARRIAEEEGDDIALGHVLQNWSYVAGRQEDVEMLLAVSEGAVEVATRTKGRYADVPLELDQKLFFSLLNLGEAHRLFGHTERSLEMRTEALHLAKERDQSLWAAFAFEEIGSIHHQRGERDLARDAYNEALSLYRSAGARYQADDLIRMMRDAEYVLDPVAEAPVVPGRRT